MNTERLEEQQAGYRCRGCGITVFGWKHDKLCTDCRCRKEGYRAPTAKDKTNDEAGGCMEYPYTYWVVYERPSGQKLGCLRVRGFGPTNGDALVSKDGWIRHTVSTAQAADSGGIGGVASVVNATPVENPISPAFVFHSVRERAKWKIEE